MADLPCNLSVPIDYRSGRLFHATGDIDLVIDDCLESEVVLDIYDEVARN